MTLLSCSLSILSYSSSYSLYVDHPTVVLEPVFVTTRFIYYSLYLAKYSPEPPNCKFLLGFFMSEIHSINQLFGKYLIW